MKKIVIFLALVCLVQTLFAQQPYVYTIKADSVKITNTCDTAELIIENHTQNVPGFLFNKGRGRTEFRKALQKINDSIYIIGGDSLRLSSFWRQGGNAFGDTGILGTKDNNHLDLYTNDARRARMTKGGNFLIGTTVDNGCRLQVDGCSNFSGNVNIGSATITNTGKLLGTNAILFNHFISQYRNYMGIDPFISKLDNILYDYQRRYVTTTSTGTDGSMSIDIKIPDHEMVTDYHGVAYPQGYMYFSFWNNGIPGSVSVMMKNSSGAWYGPFTSNTNLATNGSGYFGVYIPGIFNFMNEIVITIAPSSPGAFINLQNVEYALETGPQGLANPLPYVGKYSHEYLYYFLHFKENGENNVRISPYLTYPSYFLNNTLIGTRTDNGNKLQVVGNASIAGNLSVTGSTVTLSGLSNNNSVNRILAGDANGNLFFRDASSLASNGIMSSDLAVTGTISAQKMLITQTGRWPDYVFSRQYQLPSLTEVENFINQNNHLPGMPSAAEVEKKGIDVGDNQAALLKKIEELTLYVIEQNKKMQKQNEEITELKRMNSDMELLKQQLNELRTLINKDTSGKNK